jgi:hypothetical protein
MPRARQGVRRERGSLDGFFARVERARAELRFEDDEECFYRGHADCEWSLMPTLLRNAARKRWDDEELRDTEATLFWEFRARARELHDRNLTDWDVLFYMREHGVATRLLDWSETLAVALHFALHGGPPGTKPCIWLLNPYALNKKSWGIRDIVAPQYLSSSTDGDEYSDIMADYGTAFGWKHPVALYPVRRNPRLHVQRGYFTVHGEKRVALDQAVPKVVRRVDIEPREMKPLRTFLERAGVDEYTLFPDLDSLAGYLHRKYQLS